MRHKAGIHPLFGCTLSKCRVCEVHPGMSDTTSFGQSGKAESRIHFQCLLCHAKGQTFQTVEEAANDWNAKQLPN